MTVELAKAAGGRVDPNSLAHDMVMTLFGGMSKGERSRIRMRVRTAMAEQATHGRFLGGRPPYGYTLADASPHPNPGKGKQGFRLHKLARPGDRADRAADLPHAHRRGVGADPHSPAV